MSEPIGLRVTVGMTRAVDAVLNDLGDSSRPEMLARICSAVLGADDSSRRWMVLTRDLAGNLMAFGPYASSATARKVAESGHLASQEGTLGTILPLVSAPKQGAK